MRVKGDYEFKAPIPVLWENFTTRDFLRVVIPGCKELKEVAPDDYLLDIEIGLAGIKGKYDGTVRLHDKDYPNSYRMEVAGNGKPGFVKAEGTLEFHGQEPEVTLVSYQGEFHAGGLIAGVGQRMLEGVARLMIKQFFEAVEEQMDTPTK